MQKTPSSRGERRHFEKQEVAFLWQEEEESTTA
jgi:hypothetical protein